MGASSNEPIQNSAARSSGHGFRIEEKGAFHRKWSGSGKDGVPASYIELANGLNYWNGSDWVESIDLIERVGNVAIARQGPNKVSFAPNAKTAGAIELITPGGVSFKSHVIGLYWFDALSGKSALLALVKDSIGEIVPPNQVVYRDAFNGLKADIQYIYTKGAFQQNIVLLEKPVVPDSMDAASTRLEVWTEFLNPPEPKITPVVLRPEQNKVKRGEMAEPDLVDETLDFGELWFPPGRAFATKSADELRNAAPVSIPLTPDSPDSFSVAKRWLHDGNRRFLVEAVQFGEIAPKLKDLKQAANPTGDEDLLLFAGRRLPQLRAEQGGNRSVTLASSPYTPVGFVLDYTSLSGSQSSYTFTSGTTYYISSSFGVGSGTATFQTGCVFKFANNANLYTYGPVSFPGSGENPVFTSKDDDSVGDSISGSSGSPTYHASPALNIYFVNLDTTIQNILVRWAKTGVRYDESSGIDRTHILSGAVFRDCQTGVYSSNAEITMTGVKKCNVSTATSGTGSYDFEGSMTEDCPDLIFDTTYMSGSGAVAQIVLMNFPGNDCSVAEGLVGASGNRKLLQFGVKLKNNGTGDFWGERDHYRRVMDGSGGRPDFKIWHSCHNHCHLLDFVKYELLDGSGNPVSGVSGVGKLGWFLYDNYGNSCGGSSQNFVPPTPSTNCPSVEMGLSVGWCDEYSRGTSGQWLDITDVASGTYTLKVTINYGNKRYESNYGNNAHTQSVTVP